MESKHPQQCPIFTLDDWTIETNDSCTLCSLFSCKECVGTPEEFGYDPNEPKVTMTEGSDYVIPF